MKTFGIIVLCVLAFVAVVFGLGFLAQGQDFVLYKFFAPRYEGVRRQAFEQTKSYNQGYIQELQNMQFEYVKADKEHQQALADIILHRAADFPAEKLPPDLAAFIAKLRNDRIGTRY